MMELNNGVLALTPDEKILKGGDFHVKQGKVDDIVFYTMTLYFLNDGEEEVLMSNSISIEGDVMRIDGRHDVGQRKGQAMYREALADLEELYFQLEVKDVNNQWYDYTLKLETTQLAP